MLSYMSGGGPSQLPSLPIVEYGRGGGHGGGGLEGGRGEEGGVDKEGQGDEAEV